MDEVLLRYTTTVLAIAAGTAAGLYAVVRVILTLLTKKINDFLNGHNLIQKELVEVRRELDIVKQQLDTVKEILYSTIEIVERHGPSIKATAKKKVLKK